MAEEPRLTLIEKKQILEHYGPDAGPFVALAQRLGPEAMDVVLEELSGADLRQVPRPEVFWRGLVRRLRDERLRADFTGDNIGELAAREGLCERHVRRIVCDG